MYIHNSCIPNGDRLNLLVKTDNAYKKRMLPQTIINKYTFNDWEGEKFETQSKLMVAVKW